MKLGLVEVINLVKNTGIYASWIEIGLVAYDQSPCFVDLLLYAVWGQDMSASIISANNPWSILNNNDYDDSNKDGTFPIVWAPGAPIFLSGNENVFELL